MSYFNLYHTLNEVFRTREKNIPGSDLKFFQDEFRSDFKLPDQKPAEVPEDKTFRALLNYYLRNSPHAGKYILHLPDLPDRDFKENNRFSYFVLKPQDDAKADSAILLLHGLNERSWNKYLPWAFELGRQTKKAVILFPFAFHINRAPSEWSDPRLMQEVARERSAMLPSVRFSSFANVALSTRLQFAPERFLISGLQTYSDLIKLLTDIRTARNKFINHSATIDIFAYSIGAFLAEILFMSNPSELFSDSRLFIFCGGSVMDQTLPVSKAIMDSEAAEALNNFYIQNFDSNINQQYRIGSLITNLEEKGIIFKSMLRLDKFAEIRNSLLNQLKDRIKIVGLLKDRVFPPDGMRKTFFTDKSFTIQDFDYKYIHENPFPLMKLIDKQVTNSFSNLFKSASSYLA